MRSRMTPQMSELMTYTHPQTTYMNPPAAAVHFCAKSGPEHSPGQTPCGVCAWKRSMVSVTNDAALCCNNRAAPRAQSSVVKGSSAVRCSSLALNRANRFETSARGKRQGDIGKADQQTDGQRTLKFEAHGWCEEIGKSSASGRSHWLTPVCEL